MKILQYRNVHLKAYKLTVGKNISGQENIFTPEIRLDNVQGCRERQPKDRKK